ncbi:tetratricopeptide repeat protein 28-like [Watersipora subatra]|uniref:tetratricopeptide repeat protein 28-like n=1 Tax=Watersipora subatra TaxID=2589382 RepID=UPI00355B0FF4
MAANRVITGANRTLEEVRRRLSGEASPELYKSLNRTALTFNCSGDYRTSLELYQGCLRVAKKVYEDNFIVLGQAYIKVGRCLIRHGKYTEANEHLTTAQGLLSKVNDHRVKKSNLAIVENVFGVLERDRSRFSQAALHHKKAMTMLEAVFPDNKSGLIADTHRFIGHVYIAQTQYKKAVESYTNSYKVLVKLKDLPAFNSVKILCCLSRAFLYAGQHAYAVQSVERAKAYAQKPKFGDNPVAMALIGSTRARAHCYLLEYNSASRAFDEAQVQIKNFFGDDDAPSFHLASYCIEYGNVLVTMYGLNLALANYTRAKKIIENMYSNHHRDVGRVYNKIALAYRRLANFDRCLSFHTKAMEVFTTAYEQNQDTTDHALTDSLLGELYNELEDSEQANKHNFRSLEMNKRMYDTHNESIAIFNNYMNIACTYINEKECTQATQYLQKSGNILKEVFDPTIPNPIGIKWYHLCACAMDEKGDLDAAKKELDAAKTICRDFYPRGVHNIEMSRCNSRIAELEEKHGSIVRASTIYQTAYDDCVEFEEDEDYNGVESLWLLIKLARAWFKRYDYKTAWEKIVEAEGDLEYMLENNAAHPAMALAKEMQAEISFRGGSYEKALTLYEEAFFMMQNIYRANLNRVDIAKLSSSVAVVYAELKMYDYSLEHYKKALEIIYNVYEGTNHIDLANALELVGTAYDYCNKPEQAEPYYREALKIKSKKGFGENSNQIAISNMRIGNHYRMKKDYSNALKFYEKAMKVNGSLPILTGSNKNCADLVGETLKCLGKYPQAQQVLLNSIRKKGNAFKKLQNENREDIHLSNIDISEGFMMQLIRIEREVYGGLAESYILTGDAFYDEVAGPNSSKTSERRIKDGLDNALSFYQQAIIMLRRICNSEHVMVTSAYSKLAKIFSHQILSNHTYVQALENATKALEYRKKAYLQVNKNHSDITTSYIDLANIQTSANMFTSATENLDCVKDRLNDSCEDIAVYVDFLEAYANLEFMQESYEEALRIYQEAHAIQVRQFGEYAYKNVDLARSYVNLSKSYRKLNQWNDAKDCDKKAASIFEKKPEQSSQHSKLKNWLLNFKINRK